MSKYLKRIEKEVKYLREKYTNTDIILHYPKNSDYYILEFSIYKFYMPRDYPFKPPSLYIINENKETNYKNLLAQNGYIRKELNKMDIKCLCCSTILCPGNWSPSVTLIKVVDEYQYFKSIIKSIIYKYYLYIIMQENKIPIELYDNIAKYLEVKKNN